MTSHQADLIIRNLATIELILLVTGVAVVSILFGMAYDIGKILKRMQDRK